MPDIRYVTRDGQEHEAYFSTVSLSPTQSLNELENVISNLNFQFASYKEQLVFLVLGSAGIHIDPNMPHEYIRGELERNNCVIERVTLAGREMMERILVRGKLLAIITQPALVPTYNSNRVEMCFDVTTLDFWE